VTDVNIDQMNVSFEPNEADYESICSNLYQYNVRTTNGLLKPKDINIFLRDDLGKAIGGLFCETWLQGLYIDVFWIAEEYRNKGYGKVMIIEAEKRGKELGCTFAHTCTFSYQSPDFYKKMGYEIFGINDEYPDGIKQYFLKKKLN